MVRGVLKSWEIARSRFARIFSFSVSDFMASCRLIFVISVQVIRATIIIIMADTRFSCMVKSNLKNGNVKA